MPSTDEFIALARTHFAYLESNGFRFSSEVRGTGETVTFIGPYAAVTVSTDRRDGGIDVSIAELAGESSFPRWQSLFGFLVSTAGYRGSLREFRNPDLQAHSRSSEIQVYSSALRHFLPRLVAGDNAPLTLGPNYSLKRTDQSLRD